MHILFIISVSWAFFSFIFLVDFVQENKTTNRPESQPEKLPNSRLMTREIIISTGVVIIIVLLIVILFTMCNGFTSANVNGNCHCCEKVQVDNVYSEISWWRIPLKLIWFYKGGLKVLYEYRDWWFRHNSNMIT